MQVTKAPLGALTWFQTAADAAIGRADMEARLKGTGLEQLMPAARHDNDALRLAVSETEKEFSAVPMGEDMVGSLIFAALRSKDKSVLWDAHLQVKDSAGKKVDYKHIGRVTALPGQKPSVEILDQEDPILAMAIEAIPDRQGWYRDSLDSTQLRAMGSEFLTSLHGVRVRMGVSFVLPSQVGILGTFAGLLENLESGHVHFSVYELDSTPKNQQSLRNDFNATLSQALAALKQNVEAAMNGQAKYPDAELKRLEAELAELSANVAKIQAAVGGDKQLDSHDSLIQALRRAIESAKK